MPRTIARPIDVPAAREVLLAIASIALSLLDERRRVPRDSSRSSFSCSLRGAAYSVTRYL